MKRIDVTRYGSVSLLLVGWLAGCGGGGGGVNSGVDGNKKGSDLSEEEIAQVCEAGFDYLEQRIDVSKTACLTPGYLAAGLAYASGQEDADIQSACRNAVENCEEQRDDGGDDEAGDQTCQNTPESLPDCEATVAEYETCVTDVADAYAAYIDSIPTCDELTRDNYQDAIETAQDRPAMPKSCDALGDECPNALGGLTQG